MNKLALGPIAVAIILFISCGKQQTEAERNAEIERQVQQRLESQRRADAQRQLDAREADLAAREKALADQQSATARTQVAAETPAAPAETPVPQALATSDESTGEEYSDSAGDVPTSEDAGYDTFYSHLEPYGDWHETPDYGYVFQPRVAVGSRNWRPYTNGRWVFTDVGWTWVSAEPFGWATCHYGRWARLRHVGWVWVPGHEWAPAWVSWRKSDNYVGWAPLPPAANFDRRAGIHHWADNYYDIGPEEYAFVPTNEFGAQRLEQIVVPRERNVTIIAQTTNVTNITYNNRTIVNQGPNYDDLSRRSRQPIARLRLERGTPLEGNSPQAIVRGEVLTMPAPLIAPAQRRGRPARVKEAIADATIDHDAADPGDQSAVENARAKMRGESTPPPGLPPKKVVRPMAATTATPIPPRSKMDVSRTPLATSEDKPVMNFPDDHRKEIDQRRRMEAQRKAEEERKKNQASGQVPPVAIPASPAGVPLRTASPSAAASSAAPLAPPTVRNPIPPPSPSVPARVPIVAPPVRAKVPVPATTVAPSAAESTEKPVPNVASPPVEKRIPVSPAPVTQSPPTVGERGQTGKEAKGQRRNDRRVRPVVPVESPHP